MAVDLRKEHECRIELYKHLKENEILYGEVSPNLLITISDFILEWESRNAKTGERQLTIPDVINRLFDLQRFDIDPQWNGEFTELEERPEEDGQFVRWKDVRKLITDIRVSNGL